MVIRSLEKNLTIETGYGSIRVDEVSDQLEEIDIRSSHAGIEIKNPNDIGFRFDIHTKYGDIDIDHGSGDFTDDDNEEWAKGKRKGIGEGIIKIDSRYGNVRIR